MKQKIVKLYYFQTDVVLHLYRNTTFKNENACWSINNLRVAAGPGNDREFFVTWKNREFF